MFKLMSVEDNLRIGSYLTRDSKLIAEGLSRVYEHFPILKEKRSQLAGELSGGQQQMVAIGRAMMARPKVILMDQPSLGLAPIMVDAIAGIITMLKEFGSFDHPGRAERASRLEAGRQRFRAGNGRCGAQRKFERPSRQSGGDQGLSWRLRKDFRRGDAVMSQTRERGGGEDMVFDYVIVGSGSAGSALSYRIAETGKYKVVVLEFGGTDWGPLIQMPGALSYPMNMKRYDWGFMTEPEPHLNGRRLVCPRGKVVGGSSSVNGMVYVRGHAGDYDQWEGLGRQGLGISGCAALLQENGVLPWRRGGLAGTIRPRARDARQWFQPALRCIPARRGGGWLSSYAGLQRLAWRGLRRNGAHGLQWQPVVGGIGISQAGAGHGACASRKGCSRASRVA